MQRRAALIGAGVVMLGIAGACKSTTTVVQLPPLEMLIASGDGQFGVINENVEAPLRIVVRSEVTGSPREDVSVIWDVTQGSASFVGVSTTVTDSTGSTQVRLRMGPAPGEVHVKATVSGQGAVTATFQLFAVNRPTLSALTPGSAAAGATVTLTGSDFSPQADQNVVLFSGVRGRVLTASTTSIEVEVPTCLPARSVEVSVQLGVVPAAVSFPLTVTGGTQVATMQVGEVIDATDTAGLACYALPGGLGQQYLALGYSASALGAAQHPFELTFLSSSPAPAPAPQRAPSRPATFATGAASSPQQRWDQRLRALEDDLVRSRGIGLAGGGGPALVGPAAVPAVGERRTFNVLNPSGGFSQVSAEARYVGVRAAIFVDDEAPAPPAGFTSTDLANLASRFDDVIHPTVTGAFGATSDIDANQRVIILLTPAVNRLTPRGSNGFIGGFFYGVDLLTTSTGSNRGEIFYALVPDPAGTFSDARDKQQVLQAVPAVLAHEFQHMVHFNERVLVRNAMNQEALWLSEAMAQMAEELVARAYWDLGDGTSAQLFRSGAIQRARRYLTGPDTVSLVVTTGQGTLAERGGGFLHVLYLEDQIPNVLADLTQTTRTGVANVEQETGVPWPTLLADWWSAIWLDGPTSESGPLTYPSIDLRGYLGGPSFPLAPLAVGPGDVSDAGSLWSSSVRYYLVNPPGAGTLSVRLGGAAGGPSASQSALRLRLIRIS